MNKLKLYTAFHLNLAYSSIEEEQRSEVIQKCYWPLLHMAKKLKLPFGIESTGYTLQSIQAIDPSWTTELKRLVAGGAIEFIGSGYSQIIGPVVPAKVNAANLRLGNQVYEELLGFRPQVALINEQAYSGGLIRHYLDAGYRAILMDWDNPASLHPEWNPEYRYLPQRACSQDDSEIALIWTNSIAFQEFQRYAHGELDLSEYISYLSRHIGGSVRAFPMYCNDIEIFNFRPGRYHTEAILRDDEWSRIEKAFKAILSDERFEFIVPSQSLELLGLCNAGNRLRLESSRQPIPVKKQSKYNITRWAVTGRDDLVINSACWRIYRKLESMPSAGDGEWRELCYLWSSDFRTHITEKRWHSYLKRLNELDSSLSMSGDCHSESTVSSGFAAQPAPSSAKKHCTWKKEGRYFSAETKYLSVRLNLSKGACIDGLWFKDVSDKPLCGTLPHGYYDDINWGADYYTGHVILELPGHHKITDLNPVDPKIEMLEDRLRLVCLIQTPLGPVEKNIDIFFELPVLGLNYHLDWTSTPVGSLRVGNITLNPEAFQRNTLFYRTQNGGFSWECFSLKDVEVDQGQSVSLLVSANNGIGMTNGIVWLGDEHKRLNVKVDMTASSPIGLMTCKSVGENYFCRLALSLLEVDETCKNRDVSSKFKCSVGISLSACQVTQPDFR